MVEQQLGRHWNLVNRFYGCPLQPGTLFTLER